MSSSRRAVVVGTGITAVSAAGGLRAAGFDGEIVLIGEEPELPYRRPPVSKEVLRGDKGADQIRIKPEKWYVDQRVELLTGTRVIEVDAAARHVVTDGGDRVGYDSLLIATGGRPRTLTGEVDGVHTLRGLADVPGLRADLAASDRLVVVGAGLVGSEIAASARAMGCEVTLLESAPQPLPRLLPADLGQVYVDLHKEHGTQLCTDVQVAGLERRDGETVVRAVDGRSWSAPVVVVAVGMEPATELGAAAGAMIDNGIVVDERGATAVPGVFAAGDVANRPEPVLGGRIRVEHWQGAQNHGTAVGRAMAGEEVAFGEVPWCWSDQYSHNLQVTGWPDAGDHAVVRGSLEDRDASVFFLRGDQLVGALTLGRPGDVRAARALIGARARVRIEALADVGVPVADSLAP